MNGLVSMEDLSMLVSQTHLLLQHSLKSESDLSVNPTIECSSNTGMPASSYLLKQPCLVLN